MSPWTRNRSAAALLRTFYTVDPRSIVDLDAAIERYNIVLTIARICCTDLFPTKALVVQSAVKRAILKDRGVSGQFPGRCARLFVMM